MELCGGGVKLRGAAWRCVGYVGLRKTAQDYVACDPLRFTGKRGLAQTVASWDAGCRKLPQTGANWRKLAQVGASCITPIKL